MRQYTTYSPATRTTASALLGQAPDACVAAQLGMPTTTVRTWRIHQHIPPYRLCRSTARYFTLLRAHPEGLTARQIQDALGATRQAAFFMLHALARRGDIECVMVPNAVPLRKGGRAHTMCWRLLPETGEDTHD